MIQLKEKLYCVEVPSDATEIYLNEFGSFIDYNSNNISRTLQLNFYANKILGEVTKDEINFCCYEIVKDYVVPLKDTKAFLISINSGCNDFKFRSLLQSKGIYFENKLCDYSEALKRHIISGEWQKQEDKKIKGKLIILEKL